MPMVALRRLASLVAILYLAGLSTVRTERVHWARAVADTAGAPASRGRRRVLLSAVLLGVAAPPARAAVEQWLEGGDAERFRSLDINADQRLTHKEYKAMFDGVAGETGQFQHMATFTEADIDGDGLLSLPEYVFSRFLTGESLERKVLIQLERKLPPGFIQSIDDMFLGLRQQYPGKVREAHLLKAVCQFFGEEELIEDDRVMLQQFFEIVDVTQDGVLNLNELDFLHFVLRKSLIDGALPIAEDPIEALENQLAALFAMCDTNEDGSIDEDEVVERLVDFYSDSSVGTALFRDRILGAFRSADADGNGVLNREEAVRFVEDIDGTHKV